MYNTKISVIVKNLQIISLKSMSKNWKPISVGNQVVTGNIVFLTQINIDLAYNGQLNNPTLLLSGERWNMTDKAEPLFYKF